MRKVYVGRGTPFGNPVKIGGYCSLCNSTHLDAGSTLNCYRLYLWWRLTGNGPGRLVAKRARLVGCNLDVVEFRQAMLGLRDKVLVCPGCGLGAGTCHMRILERAIKWCSDICA